MITLRTVEKGSELRIFPVLEIFVEGSFNGFPNDETIEVRKFSYFVEDSFNGEDLPPGTHVTVYQCGLLVNRFRVAQ